MKSIVVNFLGQRGAGPEYAYEMTKGLLECGCKVYAIIPTSISNLDKWKKLSLSKLILINTYTDYKSFIINTIKLSYKTRKYIKDIFYNVQIDICYVPMIQPWTLIVNTVFNKSIKIVTIHDPKPHRGSNLIFDYISYLTIRQADKVVLLSKSFITYTCKKYKIKPENIITIPHGPFSNYDNPDVKNSFKSNDSKFNFLFFGRITPYKGIDILAKAYNKLFKERKDITLTIAGFGDISAYKPLFRLEQNIYIINRYINDNEIAKLFHNKNTITVLPYIEATQSGVIPIAMREKSLIIATNTGGLFEQTQDGSFALLCEPNNVDSLYNVMKEAIENYSEFSKKIEEAYAYIMSLSWGKLAERLVE